MNEALLSAFRKRLEKELAALHEETRTGAYGARPVTLDQQSVGRLSRMDAMQQQAMAKATQARRKTQVRRIQAALTRLKEEEFGYCSECGEKIALARLEFDPTIPTCIGCAAS
ncbi:TraR/DksA family transcriptional regulator [Rhodovulum imhoffii]|uniref:TraR/DksA family transcriptional regulator n=1 Tax=Rhodovulum imhoffii TaxID=365340 RepID=A0A2T5BVA0_9RHOB|nr:TraR/DksA family transcriptional regulator [Rhodovulum imhoffii]MBK5934241.1 molecular chaperone DnaK [Rhodovulum imhoffii]PTN03512.1 TraR/DksA family transcriptional regulator [Rhodovulum imhoffii]